MDIFQYLVRLKDSDFLSMRFEEFFYAFLYKYKYSNCFGEIGIVAKKQPSPIGRTDGNLVLEGEIELFLLVPFELFWKLKERGNDMKYFRRNRETNSLFYRGVKVLGGVEKKMIFLKKGGGAEIFEADSEDLLEVIYGE